jgi:hypothetical protein
MAIGSGCFFYTQPRSGEARLLLDQRLTAAQTFSDFLSRLFPKERVM